MEFLKYLTSLMVLSVILFSCSQDQTDEGSNTTTPDFGQFRSEINENMANHIIFPAYEALAVKTSNLENSITEFTTSLDGNGLNGVRQALKAAWMAWQEAAIYNFGPAENVALRKSLNIYPTDADKIEANIQGSDFILGSIDNKAAIGFPAIDYLVNGLSTDDESIISLFKENENRIDYLKALGADIALRANETANAWDPAGGNYIATYSSANGTDIGSSLGILVNAIDLHYQRFLRDGKLAIPAGVRSAGVPRPKTTEAFYGGYSAELLVTSLDAYLRMFKGIGMDDQDRIGILDYLELLGEDRLAQELENQIVVSTTEAAQLSDPLSNNIESNLEQVTNVFLELQKIVPLLKADMASKMGIIITNTDNDGD